MNGHIKDYESQMYCNWAAEKFTYLGCLIRWELGVSVYFNSGDISDIYNIEGIDAPEDADLSDFFHAITKAYLDAEIKSFQKPAV